MNRNDLSYDDRFVLACAHLALEYRRRIANAGDGDYRVLTAAGRWATDDEDLLRLVTRMSDAIAR